LISEKYNQKTKKRNYLDLPIQVPFYQELKKEYQEEIWKKQN
jgi:hypothetical protein